MLSLVSDQINPRTMVLQLEKSLHWGSREEDEKKEKNVS